MLISAGANFIHLFLLPCLAPSLASPTGAQPSAALGHGAQLGQPLLFSGTLSLAQQLQAQPCAEVTLTVCLCSGEQEVKFQTEHKTPRLHLYQLHPFNTGRFLEFSDFSLKKLWVCSGYLSHFCLIQTLI